MKKFVLIIVVAVLCTNSLRAQSDAEFRQMVQHYWQVWSYLDPDKSASLYSKDPDLVFFDVTPLKYQGWNEYAAGVKKAFATTATAKFNPNDDIKSTRHGDVAWTTETFHGVLTARDGKVSNLTGRHTVIWQKIGGKWLIVHDHVSVPAGE